VRQQGTGTISSRVTSIPPVDRRTGGRGLEPKPEPAVPGPLPAGNHDDDAAAGRIAQKQDCHGPIALIDDRVGHCRQMRDEKQRPCPERNGFGATLVLDRLGNLRNVGQETKTVEESEHGKGDVCDCHDASSTVLRRRARWADPRGIG
jgi:hypothetical protein